MYPLVKRLFDVLASALGLLLLSPVLAVVAFAVKLCGGGPVFYRQRRVGQHGVPFDMWKFRTMIPNADQRGALVTKDRDDRITRAGRVLRKTKLDELPQLWNVLRGDMSLVGPRPEVPRYLDRYTEAQKTVLEYKPGITDLATLLFRNEEALLEGAADVETFYLQYCVPRKTELNLSYAKRAGFFRDLWLICATLMPYWLGVIVLYSLVLLLSFWIACQLRFDFRPPAKEMRMFWLYAAWMVPLKLLLLLGHRHFSGLLSHFNVFEVRQMATVLGLAILAEMLVWHVSGGAVAPGRSVLVIDAMVSLLLLCGVRLALRQAREALSRGGGKSLRKRRLAILGADNTGAALARQLTSRHLGRIEVVAFFDDDADKWQKRVNGIPVLGMAEGVANGSWRERLDEVVIAGSAFSPSRLRKLKDTLARANLKHRVVPGIDQIAMGEVAVSWADASQVDDLLGRTPVRLDTGRARARVAGKRVLVTGAAGKLGAELGRVLLEFWPQQLNLVDADESGLYRLREELSARPAGHDVLAHLLDGADPARVRSLLAHCRPDLVVHAGLRSNPALLEAGPREAIRVNLLGTRVWADEALACGVPHFVMVSTVRVVHPVSVLGRTRLLGELCLHARQSPSPGSTRFAIARLDSFLGGPGCLSTVFQEQIIQGGPVWVPDAQMTQQVMFLSEAADAVLGAAAGDEPGIYALDVGPPVKAIDLAESLIELHGYRPSVDVELQVRGLRPWEPLSEALAFPAERFVPTGPGLLRRAGFDAVASQGISATLDRLVAAAADSAMSDERLRQLLAEAVAVYLPRLVGTKEGHAPAHPLAV